MKKDEFIIFRRFSLDKGNKDFLVNRKELIEWMEDIKYRHEGNNEFAKKFIKILPETRLVIIDVDRNRDRIPPFVTCATVEDWKLVTSDTNENCQPAEIIEIPGCHKIIWGKLNELIEND